MKNNENASSGSPPKAEATGSNPVGCASFQGLSEHNEAGDSSASELCSSHASKALLALADRVEALAGSSKAANVHIWRAVDPNSYAMWEARHCGILSRSFDEAKRQEVLLANAKVVAKPYSASIDAAMSLVPGGWGGKLFFSEDRPDRELHCSATLARSYPTNAQVYSEKSGKDGDRSALARALTAAALRARATP